MIGRLEFKARIHESAVSANQDQIDQINMRNQWSMINKIGLLPHFYSTAEKKNYQNGFISKTGLEIPKFVSGTGFDFH